MSGKSFLIYVRVMDHSLGALLAQNNDHGHEQAIYYLSRPWSVLNIDTTQLKKNAWRWYCYSENATLPGEPKHTRHIKSQSFKIADDEAIIAECSIGKMGHITLPIRDVIPVTKSCEGTGSGKLLGWTSRFKNDQTVWRSPRWDHWSLHDPDVFQKIGMATLLRRRIKRSSRKYHSRSEGSTYFPTELHTPRTFLLTESCSNNVVKYNALLIGMQIAD